MLYCDSSFYFLCFYRITVVMLIIGVWVELLGHSCCGFCFLLVTLFFSMQHIIYGDQNLLFSSSRWRCLKMAAATFLPSSRVSVCWAIGILLLENLSFKVFFSFQILVHLSTLFLRIGLQTAPKPTVVDLGSHLGLQFHNSHNSISLFKFFFP